MKLLNQQCKEGLFWQLLFIMSLFWVQYFNVLKYHLFLMLNLVVTTSQRSSLVMISCFFVLLYYAFYFAKVESSVTSQVPQVILSKNPYRQPSTFNGCTVKRVFRKIFPKFLGLDTYNDPFLRQVKAYTATDKPMKKKLWKKERGKKVKPASSLNPIKLAGRQYKQR